MKLTTPLLSPLAALAAGLFAASLAGCHYMGVRGSGIRATEARSVDSFHAVHLSGSADVQIEVGQPTSLTITGDDNLLPYVLTRVEDGELRVSMKSGSYSWNEGLVVHVGTPELDAASISGSGDMQLVDVAGEQLSLEIRGSGDVSATGNVAKLEAFVSGSGDFKLGELQVRDASIAISGSGDARVRALEKLDVSITGSGEVRFHGDPVVHASIRGSGDVRRLD